MKSFAAETFAIFGVIVLAIEITLFFSGHSKLSDLYQHILILIIAFLVVGIPIIFRKYSAK